MVPIVTLPGNPVSSYVSFEVFLRPAIRAAMGHPDITRPMVRAPLTAAIDSPAGKRQFRRGHLDTVAGTVAPWGGPGSHLLSWLAGADCMFVIAEDVTHLDAGDRGRGLAAELTSGTPASAVRQSRGQQSALPDRTPPISRSPMKEAARAGGPHDSPLVA